MNFVFFSFPNHLSLTHTLSWPIHSVCFPDRSLRKSQLSLQSQISEVQALKGVPCELHALGEVEERDRSKVEFFCVGIQAETLWCKAELCRKGPQFSVIPIFSMHPEMQKRSSSCEGLGLLPQGRGNGGGESFCHGIVPGWNCNCSDLQRESKGCSDWCSLSSTTAGTCGGLSM